MSDLNPTYPSQPEPQRPAPAPMPPAPPAYNAVAPYGVDPQGRPYSDKSRIIAGILQLFLVNFGVGRFYVGNNGVAIAQLFTCGGLGVWSLIDGIIFLVSDTRTDTQGRPLRS